MSLYQLAHLVLREPHGIFEERAVRVQDELDHAFWILAALEPPTSKELAHNGLASGAANFAEVPLSFGPHSAARALLGW